ncbi:MAG: hypothetical protein MAG581_01700 [Deltaproteobacteria bacterium]|jgi:predicted RNA binding protein YcfA (HicA-like mRNA interferase family)|nr:hypothetical protein [Deltaproteobacteria bacterium]
MDKIRSLSYQKLTKIFEAAGCVYSHTKGDHLVFHFKGAIRPVVIPKYKEVPVFIIKNNMKVIGMSRDAYLELAAKV